MSNVLHKSRDWGFYRKDTITEVLIIIDIFIGHRRQGCTEIKKRSPFLQNILQRTCTCSWHAQNLSVYLHFYILWSKRVGTRSENCFRSASNLWLATVAKCLVAMCGIDHAMHCGGINIAARAQSSCGAKRWPACATFLCHDTKFLHEIRPLKTFVLKMLHTVTLMSLN